MSLFNPPRPKGFHHNFIYVDERKERLEKLERQAKREKGLISDETVNLEDFRGTFTKAQKHLRKRKEKEAVGRKPFGVGALLFLIILLAAVWFYLVM